MPRPAAPPTPGSSSDIRGREGSIAGFPALPPSGYLEDQASASSSPSNNGSDSSYHPVSPGTVAPKRPSNASGGIVTKDDFALPPPPTRSRKIIQMKPRNEEEKEEVSPQSGKLVLTVTNGSKKKQASASTAAGRKIARKTAHSLIERRRRSKMNEEFGVLKDMIPACKGQEMHKLAILQASIEYLRYLEQCVQDLQTQKTTPSLQAPPLRTSVDEDGDEDEEMDDQENEASTPATSQLEQSNSIISLPSLSKITSASTTSPSIFSAGAGRHYSISSASQASYSPYFHSNQASPAFGPQLHAPSYAGAFGIGSPALQPIDKLRQIAEGATELTEKRPVRKGSEQDLDHEATAALLMLNNDRRQWRGVRQESETRSSTGMSVKNLLSG